MNRSPLAIAKRAARAFLPGPVQRSLSTAYDSLRLRRAAAAIAAAPAEPAYLGADQLRRLCGRHSVSRSYFYDADSLLRRGEERAAELLSLVQPRFGPVGRSLELGCGDGMVSAALQRTGVECIAVDRKDSGFDDRAAAAGACFHPMDAAELSFADDSFDIVFSFNAFEHFPRPDRVVEESLRVLRPGGLMVIDFGPLFMSPFGMHAYYSIPVPYCHHLFRIEDMEQYIREKNLPAVDFSTHVNGWTVARFRELWRAHQGAMTTESYRETRNCGHLGLIREFPSCFRDKHAPIDEFVVVGIRALFRKKAATR